ncbi:hypothetical protein [Arthrobacter sp. HLT1-20]
MGYGSGEGTTRDRRMDARALRFAIIFAVLLSAALLLGGFLIRAQLPNGVVLPLGGSPLPVPLFLGIGVVLILLLGAGLGSQGARISLPSTARRVLLGVAVALQLAVFTLFVATLLGQGAQGGLPPVRVDGFVLLMGCGLAAAMGVVLAMTFKPVEQWSAADDRAMAQALAAQADPTAANDQLAYFLHPRSSVIIMILLTGILPGTFLALINPWIFVASAGLALLVVGMLCATVEVDRMQLRVKLLGVVPVLIAPCEGLDAAVSLDIVAKDYGGWGLRRHSGSVSYLTHSGAAVVLRQNDGGRVVVSAPDLDIADDLAQILNRRAGKAPGQH